MQRRTWGWLKYQPGASVVALALVLLAGGVAVAMAGFQLVAASGQRPPNAVMLILRGIASAEAPRTR